MAQGRVSLHDPAGGVTGSFYQGKVGYQIGQLQGQGTTLSGAMQVPGSPDGQVFFGNAKSVRRGAEHLHSASALGRESLSG